MAMTGYLTVPEAAGRLHMHPSTLRRWIQRGWIVALKLPNGRYLVPEAEVEKALPVVTEVGLQVVLPKGANAALDKLFEKMKP